jgi:hypothetical protein
MKFRVFSDAQPCGQNVDRHVTGAYAVHGSTSQKTLNFNVKVGNVSSAHTVLPSVGR